MTRAENYKRIRILSFGLGMRFFILLQIIIFPDKVWHRISMPHTVGAIPFQLIRDMMDSGYVVGADPAAIQPSSLDLTVTDEIYRLRGSYLPRPGERIKDIIDRGLLYKANLDFPLEVNGVYLVKLAESLKLPPGLRAASSNKSSSGRVNLRSRLMANGVPRFDSIPASYAGELWLELVPKSFPVRLHPGDRVNQIRFYHGDARLSGLEHRMLYDRYGLLRDHEGKHIPASEETVRDGITMTIDLQGNDPIGWRAIGGPAPVLDTHVYTHDPREFFEPMPRPVNGEVTLSPGILYILATKERIIVPPGYAMEMANYDPSKGEFRSHFAGFFDPGWGWDAEESKRRGTLAVLEVEVYGNDFVLRDGQPICLMVYERLIAPSERLYGSALGSHYAEQTGPRLAKWFDVADPRRA